MIYDKLTAFRPRTDQLEALQSIAKNTHEMSVSRLIREAIDLALPALKQKNHREVNRAVV